MATTAEDVFDSAQPAARLPLSAHRAFPAIVAVWFAALLVAAALVVPTGIIERAVDASGLAKALPAAAPPLGMTARLLIAAAAALAGAPVGLWVASRIAAATGAVTGREARVFSARDELEDEGILGPLPLSTQEPDETDELVARMAQLRSAEEGSEASVDIMHELFPPAMELDRRREQRRGSAAAPAPMGLERRVFLRRGDDAEAHANVTEFVRQPDSGNVAPPPAVPSWQAEPLEDLGLVQLVERLGASLARSRALAAESARSVDRIRPASAARELEPAAAEDAAQAMAAYFARPSSISDHGWARDEHAGSADPACAALNDFGRSAASVVPVRQDDPGSQSGDDSLRKALAALERLNRSA